MNIKKLRYNKHIQSILTQLGGAIIALGSFMILARTFSKVDFGQWILYLSLITFVDMIKSGMVQSAYVKYASGSNDNSFDALQGSSWALNLFITFIITALSISIYCTDFFDLQGVVVFLLMYPVYALCSMPFNYFLWNSQIKLSFSKVALGRIVQAALFLLVSALSFLVEMSFKDLVIAHSITFFVVSLYLVVARKSGILTTLKANRTDLLKYWNFGKFHSLAFLGSNLLKSADTFLIGGLLGPLYVAIYSIPLRLVELIEMPLKGVVSVAYPVFSGYHNNGQKNKLKESLEQHIGVLTILYIPFIFILFIFSDQMVAFVGGEKYADTGAIFRMFLIYGLFLPFDRLTGVVLDAMGKPNLNFYKVCIMATVNVVGDIIVLHYFQSLEYVALITIANVIAGMVVGYFLTKEILNITLLSILSKGSTAIIKSFNHFKTFKL